MTTIVLPLSVPADDDLHLTVTLQLTATGYSATPDRLRVAGELDLATAEYLDDALRRFDRIDRPLTIDLDGVAFTDSAGLQPVVDCVRRRAAAGVPVPTIESSGRAVRHVFEALAVRWQPTLDTDAWDRAGPRAAPAVTGAQDVSPLSAGC